jgi:predicted HicB family RNase H-like nuclease
MNFIEIDDTKAFIQYDPEIEMFRGEFVGLNGGADFYGKDIDTLKKEAEISLRVFLEICKEDNVEPYKKFSGKFNVRIKPEIHEKLTILAKSKMISLNDIVNSAITHEIKKSL